MIWMEKRTKKDAILFIRDYYSTPENREHENLLLNYWVI